MHNEEKKSVDDMNTGLGIDVVEIERVSKVIKRTKNFINRIYTEQEIDYCNSKFNPDVHFSTLFAAKEAALKALGMGILCGVSMHDIEIVHNEEGRPDLLLRNKAKEVFESKNLKDMLLSLTFTSTDAVACVISIFRDKPQHTLIPDKNSENPTDAITQMFKEVRGIV